VDFLIAHEELDGVVNISSPNPLPNRDFMKALRAAWGVEIGLPAKAWMIESGACFMRTESELVLKSRRVVPGRLLASGFTFVYPDWPAAARELVSRYAERRDAAS
jgi:NAD dependent epimerase/dehydratase family enzyme